MLIGKPWVLLKAFFVMCKNLVANNSSVTCGAVMYANIIAHVLDLILLDNLQYR